jgi:hypothetical protein
MMRSTVFFITIVLATAFLSCQSKEEIKKAPQWKEIAISLQAEDEYDNPYTDVVVYAVFNHPEYGEIKRPAFWDGGQSWKIRFASPVSEGRWTWETICSNTEDKGLHGREGKVEATEYTGSNELIRHGLLGMSEGHRNVVHADGTPFPVVGDTPWALPWRATYEMAQTYADDRSRKGFNAALLMSFCPDTKAEGPDARATKKGFARAFRDIGSGHINKPVVSYFQYMDSLMNILVNHEIVPVYQPIFHGFGWKGKGVLGWNTVPAEYERYMKYLIARYGAKPAFWLVGGDGDGRAAGLKEAGQVTEKWDAYNQPTGIHYNPFDEPSEDHPDRYPHRNKMHQAKEWLDFQWCQTGHGGDHQFDKVVKMYDNKPVKAVANGEPTYEGIREPSNASGWWQGREAWGQLMHGGTMGVVYGAGGLWQWKITPDEKGWPDWADSKVSWKEALHLDGSRYVGYVRKALEGLDITDIKKRPDLAGGKRCLAKPGKVYIAYMNDGGSITLEKLKEGLPYRWFDPKAGQFRKNGKVSSQKHTFQAPGNVPWVLIVGED